MDGLGIYGKARAVKAKATKSRPAGQSQGQGLSIIIPG